MRRAPAHAGRLRPWERSVFAVVFILMLAFVVAITLSAARPKHHPVAAAGPSAGTHALTPGPAGSASSFGLTSPGATPASTGAVPQNITSSAALSRRLSAALASVRRAAPGRLAVGVIDPTTGTEAMVGGGRSFRSAGLAGTDLVAALLLKHQRSGQPFSSAESGDAAALIQSGSPAAAKAVSARVRSGLAAANATLKLRRTRGARWDHQVTTVSDQLQLLMDLSAANSPLDSAARDYLVGLMVDAASGQRWGVASVAGRSDGFAVKDGWLATDGRWEVNSTGIVDYDGHALLIAVLSSGSATKAAGVSMVRAAAVSAAHVIAGAAG
jgi:hypothetical protein